MAELGPRRRQSARVTRLPWRKSHFGVSDIAALTTFALRYRFPQSRNRCILATEMVKVDPKKDERCREQKWRAKQWKTPQGLTRSYS